MSYRKAMVVLTVALVVFTGYDVWVTVSGNLDIRSYIPGIYPVACVISMIGVQVCKRMGC